MTDAELLDSGQKPRITRNPYADEPRFRWCCRGRATRDYGATPYQAWMNWWAAVVVRRIWFKARGLL